MLLDACFMSLMLNLFERHHATQSEAKFSRLSTSPHLVTFRAARHGWTIFSAPPGCPVRNGHRTSAEQVRTNSRGPARIFREADSAAVNARRGQKTANAVPS